MDLKLMPFTARVQPIVDQLAAAPELWNEFPLRTDHPASPHREMDDIIVRYNARENFAGDRSAFNESHDAVWWESAKRLPGVFPVVWDLMRLVEGERLGMVLITRQPAGATCYPHVDGGWHAKHYDKYAVQLQSAPRQCFFSQRAGGMPIGLETSPGDVFFFNNSIPHWVTNPTEHGRMTMIVCIRTRFTGH